MLGGGTDPALGNAMMVAFVPVVEDGDRFVAAEGGGTPGKVMDVGWVQACESSGPGRLFSVEAPASRWTRDITGVLMVLVYNQSGRLAHPASGVTFAAQLEFFGASKDIVPAEPTPVSRLPGDMKEETRERLDALLGAQPSQRLRRALTRLP